MRGNLDPLMLIVGGAALDRATSDVLANCAEGRPIFNLGHGILPETPIAPVEQTCEGPQGLTTPKLVIPAKAGVQYPGASRPMHKRLWNTDHPLETYRPAADSRRSDGK